MERIKTQIEELERSIYDIRDTDHGSYQVAVGLTEEIVREISRGKNEPEWMLELRLKSLKLFQEMDMPAWGPSLHELDMDQIVTYVRPDAQMSDDWQTLPEDIRGTFDRLGIQTA